MRRDSRIHNEEAQSLIEFALFITFAMLMLLGTIDFSRFMYFDTAIHSAARLGAEVAGNHCTPSCGTIPVTTVDWVVETTVCEASIGLQPQPVQGCNGCAYIKGGPGGCNDPYNTSTTTYSPTAPSLTQDVYVSPAYAPDSPDPGLTSPTVVTVSVGYNFTPVTPLMQQFFQPISCFPGDSVASNHHTLCATAVGKISS